MSQIKFKATYQGKPVEVMAGWDRPCSDFYMTIFDLDTEEEKVVWSALDVPDARDRAGTARLEAQLVSMVIEAPEGFWARIRLREGNVVFSYPCESFVGERDQDRALNDADQAWKDRDID